MSETKAKLQKEVERMTKIVQEAALLLDVIDSMDYDHTANKKEIVDMTNRLRNAVYDFRG